MRWGERGESRRREGERGERVGEEREREGWRKRKV
jgi:hypothetical protein